MPRAITPRRSTTARGYDILVQLAWGRKTKQELVEATGANGQTVSHHIRHARDAGLVRKAGVYRTHIAGWRHFDAEVFEAQQRPFALPDSDEVLLDFFKPREAA